MLKLSVCIPAYNRPNELERLLRSLLMQSVKDWEVVVSEDCSQRATEIERVVAEFITSNPAISVRYYHNETNMGYDANLRCLLERAKGDYCMFLGDDDIVLPDACELVLKAIGHDNIGVVLRAWTSIDANSGREVERHSYFRDSGKFLAGTDTVVAFYRRSVFISGLTLKREPALDLATCRFDGTLLYQLYLVGRLLYTMDGYYIAKPVVLRRIGGCHYFGSSRAERLRFTPGGLAPQDSLRFVEGMLQIAKVIASECDERVYPRILRSIVAYCYPLLAIQAERVDKVAFHRYARELSMMGFSKSAYFWMYYGALMSLGPRVCNSAVRAAKRILGSTPVLGGEQRGPISSREDKFPAPY